MIRLFVTRTIPESTIETYFYTEKNDDNEDFELEFNLIIENLNKIFGKIGEEKILECDDGYKEQVLILQGKVPKSINELQEEMLKIYGKLKMTMMIRKKTNRLKERGVISVISSIGYTW